MGQSLRYALGAWLLVVLSSSNVDGELEGQRPLSAYVDSGEDPPAELLMPVPPVAAASAVWSVSTAQAESLRTRVSARSGSGGEYEADLAYVTKCIEVRVCKDAQLNYPTFLTPPPPLLLPIVAEQRQPFSL
jgi:hypothetical protein